MTAGFDLTPPAGRDMETLFSVILPTYNRAYVLWRAVQSVLAQTEPRWELLVVDDGSTDATALLIEEFQDTRIRLFKTARRGPSAARNHGARRARGAYVAYLDSDNTWRAEHLAVMRSAIARHDGGMLGYCGQRTSIWRRTADGARTLERELVETRAQYTTADVLQLKGADTSCIVHRAEMLAEVGGWDEACRWLEDWDLFARCVLRYPGRVHWVPETLVEYRQVFGADVDGVCATTVQDPARNRAAWRYLIDKWRDEPGFAATAARLAAKHLNVSQQSTVNS